MASGFSRTAAPPPVDVLRPSGQLPARLVAPIEHPIGLVETSDGVALVLDGGSHTVYAIDAARTRASRIIQVGREPGRILNPSGFSLGSNDILAISDAPGDYTRVQYFDATGRLINSFYTPAQGGVRRSGGRLTMRGAGSLAFTGRTFVLNSPVTGALMSEFDATGDPIRSIGTLRPTGHEADRAVHEALNTGLPIFEPDGGCYFVFDTGVPLFRRYDRSGRLMFERHIEGVELDGLVSTLPARWPTRDRDDVWPVAPALVHAAALDRTGRLWVSLAGGVSYVFDQRGDKIRTVRFEGAGDTLLPTSFYFASRNRLLVMPGGYEFMAG